MVKPQENKSVQKRQTQWTNPFDEMARMFDSFRASGWWPWRDQEGWHAPTALTERIPRIDLMDEGNYLMVRAELPGVDKDKIHLSVNERTLTIKGESRFEHKEQEEGKFFRQELRYGTFFRNLPLPVDIDPERVKAAFKDGLLEIKMEKVKQPRERHISIE